MTLSVEQYSGYVVLYVLTVNILVKLEVTRAPFSFFILT